MRAVVRPQSRLVSTSSAAITHAGGFFAKDEPGKMAKRALRAPMYSRESPSFWPMWDSRPVKQRTMDRVRFGRASGSDACRGRR